MKKILYIDMDGVIADFAKGINTINPNLDMSENPIAYQERSDKVDEICEAFPEIFHDLPKIKDAQFFQISKRRRALVASA